MGKRKPKLRRKKRIDVPQKLNYLFTEDESVCPHSFFVATYRFPDVASLLSLKL